jgi:hypothetical protein
LATSDHKNEKKQQVIFMQLHDNILSFSIIYTTGLTNSLISTNEFEGWVCLTWVRHMVYMYCNRNEMIGILAIVQQSQMHAVQWYKPRSFAFGFNKVLMGH